MFFHVTILEITPSANSILHKHFHFIIRTACTAHKCDPLAQPITAAIGRLFTSYGRGRGLPWQRGTPRHVKWKWKKILTSCLQLSIRKMRLAARIQARAERWATGCVFVLSQICCCILTRELVLFCIGSSVAGNQMEADWGVSWLVIRLQVSFLRSWFPFCMSLHLLPVFVHCFDVFIIFRIHHGRLSCPFLVRFSFRLLGLVFKDEKERREVVFGDWPCDLHLSNYWLILLFTILASSFENQQHLEDACSRDCEMHLLFWYQMNVILHLSEINISWLQLEQENFE